MGEIFRMLTEQMAAFMKKVGIINYFIQLLRRGACILYLSSGFGIPLQ